MSKKRVAVFTFVILLATGVFAIGRQNSVVRDALFASSSAKKAAPSQPQAVMSSLPLNQQSQNNTASQTSSTEIPKHVVYGLLFHELTAFKKKAEEIERQGKDGSFLRNYHKNKARINDYQDEVLSTIANDCQSAVDKLDQQAKKIIDDARALHPGGKLNKGEVLPEAPKELKDLEQQRIIAILHSRDELRTVFGNDEFQRFDNFAQQDAANRVKPITRGPHSHQPPANGFNKRPHPKQ
jgi:hypothetical protein